MKYPASKHYKHLDPSEPIPEIELRMNEYKLRTASCLVRQGPYLVAFVFVVMMALLMTGAPLLLRTYVFFLMILAIGAMVLGRVYWKTTKEQRRSWHDAGDPWGIPVKLMIKSQLYTLAILVVMMQFTSSSGGVMNVMFYLGFYALGGGIAVAISSRILREPGQISCTRCSYPLVGLRLPCDCPECGSTLRDLSDATDRPRVRDNRYLFLGFVAAVLGVFCIYVRMSSPAWAYGPIPNTLLIRLAPNDTDTFNALIAKALSAEEEEQLEESLISAIERGNVHGFWMHAQGAWLEARAFNGQLTESQFGRLMSAMGEPYIDAPDSVRAGERFSMLLRAPDVRFPAYSLYPRYYFSGYQLTSSGEPFLRSDSPRNWRSIRNGEVSELPASQESPLCRFTPEQPGVLTIRARLVLVLYPSTAELNASGFAWGNDDSFSFVNPPLWSRVIDLEHTIEVTE
ncbi:MAG: hypothetical protein ACF8LL_12120, partial [Phycisphaerales bacterium]